VRETDREKNKERERDTKVRERKRKKEERERKKKERNRSGKKTPPLRRKTLLFLFSVFISPVPVTLSCVRSALMSYIHLRPPSSSDLSPHTPFSHSPSNPRIYLYPPKRFHKLIPSRKTRYKAIANGK
jgi:hypothetical protein